jgi:hypothetical protein
MYNQDHKLLTERYQLINEGMDFWPTRAEKQPNGQVYYVPVFPPEWTDEFHGASREEMDKWMYSDEEAGPKKNIKYRPDLNMHLSNTNAITIVRALEPYLHHHGKTTGQNVKINHEDYSYNIPVDVFIGACKTYLQGTVGVDEPAIPSHIEPRHIRKTADVIDFKTGIKTPGTSEPVGPMMIHGGRDENYIKTRVMQLLRIAEEGKQMGAEKFSIG